MSHQEIAIPYNSNLQKALFIVTCLFSPIWAVLAPIATCLCVVTLAFGGSIGVLSGLFSSNFSFSEFLLGMGLAGGSMLAYTLLFLTIVYFGMVSFFVFGENKITLNDKGIIFPGIFLFTLGFRREQRWENLTSIQLLSTASETKLVLSFNSNTKATLKIKSKYAAELEQLLLALEVWAKPHIQDPIFLTRLEELHNDRISQGETSFTTIWENEVNRRFSSTAFVPLDPGHKLQGNRLTVTQQMAFGGLSAIYLAQNRETELVILKESVIADLAGEKADEAHRFFEREARLLMKLNHDRIARVMDYFVENGRSYLVLEYRRGRDLRHIVKNDGPLSESKMVDWAMQITDLLSYIHSADPPIIHRDLTPDNLICHDDILTLIDFGAANEYLGTATGTLVGKQAYISPEQFRGRASLASDVYALGCTMFFLVTGHDPEPLTCSSPREFFAEQKDQQGTEISEEIDKLIQECTAFAVEDRLKTAKEVKQKLVDIKEQNEKRSAIETK